MYLTTLIPYSNTMKATSSPTFTIQCEKLAPSTWATSPQDAAPQEIENNNSIEHFVHSQLSV